MKGDLSRETFDPIKRYNSVRMQQGRVLLDADWNEQTDITLRRIETEAVDLIGGCGAPMWNDGFRIVADAAGLTADEAARSVNANPPTPQSGGDFLITGGRIYVDGRLCENHRIMTYTGQDDLPDLDPISDAGLYIAYLDVWSRHVTALEDSEIREVALGGPDTTTRARTTRQVKLLRVGDDDTSGNCVSTFPEWEELIAPPDGMMTARAEPDETSKDPCIVAAGAGYRRLENQLYRVEVHEGGPRGTATFKWSRDNGSVVARWESQDTTGEFLTLGSDAVGRFSSGDWVELTDETRELQGMHGTLVRVSTAEGRTIRIDLTTVQGGGSTDIDDFTRSPIVRRWDNTDSDGVLQPTNLNWIDLEDGVQVRFSAGEYRTGDYWMVPARTVTADVEWPEDAGGNPIAQSPHGIEHDYCRLSLMRFDGTNWTEITDCRDLFPPVTELTSLYYLGGDGQEVMPDPTAPALFLPLPASLRVGVSNGEHPVAGARVQFSIVLGNGQLSAGASPLIATTNGDGVASCSFDLDSTTEVQAVEARLLKPDNTPTHLTIRFTATLSLASRVAYQPGECDRLAGATTVQEALDILCALNSAGCSIPISPGPNWQQMLALLINDHTRLNLCFEPGDYDLVEPVRFNNKESVVIHGAGNGTRFHGRTSESVFIFQCCESVTMHDLYAEVVAGDEGMPPQSNLNGVISLIDCGAISLERLTLQAPAGTMRAATCITVRNGIADESQCSIQSSTRIRGCDLLVGHEQTGVLIVNGERITIEDNRLEGSGRPTVAAVNARLRVDANYRALMYPRILNVTSVVRSTQPNIRGGGTIGGVDIRPSIDRTDANIGRRNNLIGTPGNNLLVRRERAFAFTSTSTITMRIRGFEVTATTPTPLASMWGPLFDRELAPLIRDDRHLGAEFKRVVDAMLMGNLTGTMTAPYNAWLRDSNRELPAVASQGIVVGGTTAPEARIRGNSIESVRQGIHIGLSHEEDPPGDPEAFDRAGVIGVIDNSIIVFLSSEMRGERHGIFAGNSDSLIVERNFVRVLRDNASDNLSIEGIRIYGHLGPMMIARANHLEGVRIGIRVEPLDIFEFNPFQWLVADTIAYPAQPVQAPVSVQQVNNK